MCNYLLLVGQPINIESLLLALVVIAVLSVVLGIAIVLLSRVCQVKEDPRIKEIRDLLPGSNCGACGHPGCDGFAKALVEGKGSVSDCSQTNKANAIEISNILGVVLEGNTEPTIAVVACAGGNKCQDKYDYQGYGDCIGQNMLAGGRKACQSGCMGSGTCVDKCPYNAIKCKDGYAQIDPALCRSCGLCISACPKQIIKRIPSSAKLYVACSTHNRGKDVTSVCSVGCISCGICQKVCPNDAIHLVNNVPIIDYSKCTSCGLCMEKCPRKIIRSVRQD